MNNFKNYLFTSALFVIVLMMTLPKPVVAQLVNPVKDSLIQFSDITTGNASASKHGFLPKLENSGSKYLRDDGTWQSVAAGGWSVIGSLDGVSSTALGASATSTTLYLQSASASAPGLVNTTTQTFAGTKTMTLSGSTFLGGTVSGTGVSDSTIVVDDASLTIVDNSTPSKKVQFQLSGIGANTTRTWTFDNVSDTFVGLTATQTLTNKNVSGTSANSINYFDETAFTLHHAGGKRMRFYIDAAASNTTVNIFTPSASATMAATNLAQTWTAAPNLNAGLTASGTITANENVVMANGKGIDFSATSNLSGSTSEVLSDFDFGSVSMSIAATGTSGTPSYTTNWMTYQKVGREVSLHAYLNVSSWAGPPTGNLRAQLPVAAANINAGYRATCDVGYHDNLTMPNAGIVTGVISNASNYVDFYVKPSSGTGTTTAVAVDTAFLIMFKCEYFAD